MSKNKASILFCAILVFCSLTSLNTVRLRSKMCLRRFYDSGSNFSLNVNSDSASLNGTLKNSSGAEVNASFNLNANIGNHDGILIWGSGGFAGSCYGCKLTSSYNMICTCYNSTGGASESSVSLSRLANSNGSFSLNTSDLTGYENSSTSYDLADFAFNAISDSLPLSVEGIVGAAQSELFTSGLNELSGDAKRKFKGFPKGKGLKLGSFVGNVMTAIDLLKLTVDYFWGTAVKGGNFKIKNSLSANLEFQFNDEYQTDKWKGYWPSTITPGEEKNIYIEASNCAMKSCSDTGANTEYKVLCNGRYVRFQLRLRGRDSFIVTWNDADRYNECFDILVTAEWRTSRNSAIEKISDVLVVANFATPWNGNSAAWNPYLKVELVPHVLGSRFPTLFEHCDYRGSILPMGKDNSTGVANIGTTWNDRASSMRVPPGFKVILFTDVGFKGTKKVFEQDTSCFHLSLNDKVTSYILVADDEQK